MVTRAPHHNSDRSRRAMLTNELVVAFGIFAITLLPMAYTFWQEARLCRAHYVHAVAMEIVDGEMELLAAGEWRAFTPGEHRYQVRAGAATNLPPGQFRLTLRDGRARLEWLPEGRHHGGPVVREAKLK